MFEGDATPLTELSNLQDRVLSLSTKRRRFDEPDTVKGNPTRYRVNMGRTFLTIQAGEDLYHTQNWTGKDTVIFTPLVETIMLNITSYELLTFDFGKFFLGDAEGRYNGSIAGNVLHMWKYDVHTRSCFIARSLLISDIKLYEELLQSLQPC